MNERNNVVEMPLPKAEKSARRKSVVASNPAIDKLTAPGRYYMEPAQRVHTRIPPMLHVRVGKEGTKAFAISVRIRDEKTGKHAKRRDITLGRYPMVTLADAVERGWELVRAADKGEDPNAQRDECRALAAQVPIVDKLLDAYEQSSTNRTADDIVKAIRRALPQDVLGTSAALVGPAEVVPALKAIARSGRAPTAVRTRSYIAGFLKWVNENYTYELADWVEGYKPTAPKGERDRFLSWEELDEVLKAVDAHLAPFWRNMVWLIVLTGLRRDEVAKARWSEVNLKDRTWDIPAERMKGKQRHIVPLTDGMIAIFKAQKKWQRAKKMKSEFVFSTTGYSPVSGHSKMKERLDRYCPVEDWVIHDTRRTLETLICEDLGVDDGLAHLMTAHKRRGVMGTYNRSTRFADRRKAHEVWEAAVTGQGPRKVDG